jgi:signal peptidase I
MKPALSKRIGAGELILAALLVYLVFHQSGPGGLALQAVASATARLTGGNFVQSLAMAENAVLLAVLALDAALVKMRPKPYSKSELLAVLIEVGGYLILMMPMLLILANGRDYSLRLEAPAAGPALVLGSTLMLAGQLLAKTTRAPAAEKPAVEEEPWTNLKSIKSSVRELPVLLIAGVTIIWLITAYIVQPGYVPSDSMSPTLLAGDRVLVAKFSYILSSPAPGDIVFFTAPNAGSSLSGGLGKRVVATGGTQIFAYRRKLFIDGKHQPEPYIGPDAPMNDFGPVGVPPFAVFVMGDNRPNSRDSRFFGPVPTKEVKGKVFFVYWPPERSGFIR